MRECQGLNYVIKCNLGQVEHETMLANGHLHSSYVEGLRAFAGHSVFYIAIIEFKSSC